MFQAKRQFGQNFLIDKNIAEKIVNASALSIGDKVWEIGLGKGILTDKLLERDVNLTGFEIDKELCSFLRDKYGQSIRLIEGDVLKADWGSLLDSSQIDNDSKVTIVANIPYNITSPLLYKISDYRNCFQTIILMIQKEVAERLTATPGTKEYGVLTLRTQFYFSVKKLFKVPPHLFRPKPNIDSLVVKLIPRSKILDLEDEKLFWRLVKLGFQARRKTLRNNLLNLLSKSEINRLSVMLESQEETDQKKYRSFSLSARGETLDEKDYLRLYHLIRAIRQ